MNILKRISSFAANSWREFTDIHEPKILDSQSEDDFQIVMNKNKSVEYSFYRKMFPGLLKKRNKVLEDPRSPTNDFARTPILVDTPVTAFTEILSPFNVKDMLEAVETAIECTEDTLVNNGNVEENLPNDDKEENTQTNLLNDKNILKIDEICNWNDMEFKEKPLTESLIVEISVTEPNDLTFNSNTNDIIDQDDKNCKIIGYAIKNENIDENLGQILSTSTPKKAKNKSLINKNQRTPLMSISNSPYIKNSKNTTTKTMDQLKKNRPNKKGLLNHIRKGNPKTPSTPMNPLNRNKILQSVVPFDKENF